jgi:hypothetical protein
MWPFFRLGISLVVRSNPVATFLEIQMKTFTTQDFEFYPTPDALARKMWGTFENKEFTRILEPSAGNGNLIKAMPSWTNHGYSELKVDVCEIDMSFHPALKELSNVNVVGMDFMEFGDGAAISHIIMNPPFSCAVSHVLKAWSILWDGEVVALLNAQSIKNPTKEGQFLCDLIAQNGHVEFIQDAFIGYDVIRETAVEVALVYLRKSAGLEDSFTQDLISGMESDEHDQKADSMANGYRQTYDLAIPKSEIENAVYRFDVAVVAMKEAVMSQAKAAFFEARVGQTMASRMSQQNEVPKDTSSKWVRQEIADRYGKLKDRAWTTLLRSSEFESKLSSKAQKRFEAQFNDIQRMSFSVSNIFGFLQGILDNQWEMQVEMCEDIFDEITKYSPDNTAFYKGYKSNSKHKTCGWRLKSTRFILPGNTAYFSGSISYEAKRRLQDFDKVFSILAGGTKQKVSLSDVFEKHMDELRSGERVHSDYFSVRYYPKAGTIHFYVKSQEVIDRLNKMVGQRRQWLPPVDEHVNANFWRQYEAAEKLDKTVKDAVNASVRGTSSWNHPVRSIFHSHDADRAHAVLVDVLTDVFEKEGIPMDFALTHERANEPQQLLLAA